MDKTVTKEGFHDLEPPSSSWFGRWVSIPCQPPQLEGVDADKFYQGDNSLTLGKTGPMRAAIRGEDNCDATRLTRVAECARLFCSSVRLT